MLGNAHSLHARGEKILITLNTAARCLSRFAARLYLNIKEDSGLGKTPSKLDADVVCFGVGLEGVKKRNKNEFMCKRGIFKKEYLQFPQALTSI